MEAAKSSPSTHVPLSTELNLLVLYGEEEVQPLDLSPLKVIAYTSWERFHAFLFDLQVLAIELICFDQELLFVLAFVAQVACGVLFLSYLWSNCAFTLGLSDRVTVQESYSVSVLLRPVCVGQSEDVGDRGGKKEGV